MIGHFNHKINLDVLSSLLLNSVITNRKIEMCVFKFNLRLEKTLKKEILKSINMQYLVFILKACLEEMVSNLLRFLVVQY